jgi:hypothetical protein
LNKATDRGIGDSWLESFGNEFTLVEVTTDDLVGAKTRLWVAAAKPSQAVTLVLG